MQEHQILTQARTSFTSFVAYMYPDYEFAPFHRLLCNCLDQLAHRKLLRLAVSMPPRHGKSFLCSQFLPAYLYGIDPQHKIIQTTYGSTLSYEFGGKVRRLINSPEYKYLFPDTSILGKSEAASNFTTSKEGRYLAVGRGGSVTGFGADTLILDDMLKNSEEAQSRVITDKLIKWYDSTASSRLMPNGAILQVGTRWGENDTIGYVMANEPENWRYINLAALADEEDELGRSIDEPLWASRFDFKHLNAIRERNPYYFSALYQGKPLAKGGNLLRADTIHNWSSLPKKPKYTVISIDSASKALDDHDYTVSTIWYITDGIAYLADFDRDKYEMPELVKKVTELVNKHQPQALLIEDASSGTGLLQILAKSLKHPSILVPIKPTGNAMVKLNNVTPMLNNSRALLPIRGVGTEILYKELLGFPYADNDDCVTSIRQFLAWYMEKTGLNNEKELKLHNPYKKQDAFCFHSPRRKRGSTKPTYW